MKKTKNAWFGKKEDERPIKFEDAFIKEIQKKYNKRVFKLGALNKETILGLDKDGNEVTPPISREEASPLWNRAIGEAHRQQEAWAMKQFQEENPIEHMTYDQFVKSIHYGGKKIKNPKAITNHGDTVEIYELYVGIGKALGWEWFVTEKPKNTNVRYGFVQSPICPEGEYGSFLLSDLAGFAHKATQEELDACAVLPPEGWSWVDIKENPSQKYAIPKHIFQEYIDILNILEGQPKDNMLVIDLYSKANDIYFRMIEELGIKGESELNKFDKWLADLLDSNIKKQNPTKEKTKAVQSIWVPRNFTKAQAVSWIRSHNHRADNVDVSDKWYKFRQLSPSRFESEKSITLPNGILIKSGKLKK